MLEILVDNGLLPEVVLRAGIRAICALRLRELREADLPHLVAELRAARARSVL
jgi:hypothetical protein